MADKSSKSHTTPVDPAQQRRDLLESERRANENQPRNFKDDALTDKQVSVEPDGTGPTPTETFDTEEDRRRGSGSGPPK
jgi:hypothetical protein